MLVGLHKAYAVQSVRQENTDKTSDPDVKWKDWLDGKHSGKGYIFFSKPN